jgi:hypothetical protein
MLMMHDRCPRIGSHTLISSSWRSNVHSYSLPTPRRQIARRPLHQYEVVGARYINPFPESTLISPGGPFVDLVFMIMIDHLGLMIRMQNLFAIIEGETLSLPTGREASVYGRAGQGEVKYTVSDSCFSITNDWNFRWLWYIIPFVSIPT